MDLKYKISKSIYIYDTPSSLILGTAGKAFNQIDYSNDTDDHKSLETPLLSSHTGIYQSNIIMLKQVHGDTIISPDKETYQRYPEADGIITAQNKLCLVIRTADCVPVFLFDQRKKVLGAVHSGWKGCRLNIIASMIRKMKSEYGSDENDINAYILPHISSQAYEIKMDVGQHFPKDIIQTDGNIYLDLRNNIYNSLTREHVPEKNIFVSDLCTYKNNTEFFSHRHGDKGRNLNFAYIESI